MTIIRLPHIHIILRPLTKVSKQRDRLNDLKKNSG
jgi:hypothetical protein